MATKKKATTKKAAKKKAAKKTTSKKAKAAVSRDDGTKRANAAIRRALERSKNYAASGLAAQVTETLIDEIRALDNVWHKTPEAQQAVIIARLSDRVANAMTSAVAILSARGHKAVICNLAAVTFRDAVRGTIIIAPGADMRHDMADHATKDVVLVLADPSVFLRGLENVKPDADQPKLI